MSGSDAPDLGRTLLVLHTAVANGPARSFLTRLPLVSSAGQRIVLVPATGPMATAFTGLAEVVVADYRPLTVPTSMTEMLRMTRQAVRDLRTFSRAAKQENVDTVICATTYTPMAMVAAKLQRKRCIVYCGEILFQTGETRSTKRVAAWMLVRLILALSDRVVCCSDLVRSQFHESGKAATVYPSIPVRQLKASREVARADTPLSIGLVGALTRGRGQDVAIAAVEKLVAEGNDVRLRIAGEPLDPQADQEFVAELHRAANSPVLANRVEFLGSVQAMSEFYESVRIVVNPAVFDEPFGRAAYEALAAGCGIVISDTGANSELLGPLGLGTAVHAGDVTAFARAIAQLADTPGAIESQLSDAAEILDAVAAEASDARWQDAIASVLR